jgi:hypothetical protein
MGGYESVTYIYVLGVKQQESFDLDLAFCKARLFVPEGKSLGVI